MFALDGDLDVLGAFRVRRDAVERTLSPRRDDQRLWILFMLQQFLRHEQGLEPARLTAGT